MLFTTVSFCMSPAHHAVACVFKEFPQHRPSSRKREERGERQIRRRQLKGKKRSLSLSRSTSANPMAAHRKPQLEGVQHRIPVGHADIKAVQLAQYFCPKMNSRNDDLQRGRQFDIQLVRKEARQNHQHQRQTAHKHALKVTAERRADETRRSPMRAARDKPSASFYFGKSALFLLFRRLFFSSWRIPPVFSSL